MTNPAFRTALIIGAGPGISASLCRRLVASGTAVALVARDAARLGPLAAACGALAIPADASDPAAVEQAFATVDERLGPPDLVVYNASRRLRGPLADLDPDAVAAALSTTAFGAFLAVRQAARRMVPAGRGAILLTGATAGIKGFALSAPFAMGKFALRGLAQSAARELGPKGIHVVHVVVDGGVRSAARPDPGGDATLDPDAVAAACLAVLAQPRDAWTHELDLRPWVETF